MNTVHSITRPSLSVIIPTHKRAHILRRALEHIEAQTIADKIEVIVVSDGHDEETKLLVESGKWKVPLRFFEIPKSHQGVARNRGVQEAKGKIVLFIGDDIFLAPAACERHVNAHAEDKRLKIKAEKLSSFNFHLSTSHAVLGFTTWDPALEITAAMAWLEQSGWQFGYPLIEKYKHTFIPHSLQHRFTYTSHISVPVEVAKKFPFREDVSLYGWEDIEWGQRLKHAGAKLYYEPDAHAYHHHHLTLEASLKRMETLGESAVRMEKIAPHLQVVPTGWKYWKYQFAGLLPTMRGRHAKAFLRGMRYAG